MIQRNQVTFLSQYDYNVLGDYQSSLKPSLLGKVTQNIIGGIQETIDLSELASRSLFYGLGGSKLLAARNFVEPYALVGGIAGIATLLAGEIPGVGPLLMGALRSAPFIANSLGFDLGASLSFNGLDTFVSHAISAGVGGLVGLSKGALIAKSFSAWMGSVDNTLVEAERITSSQIADLKPGLYNVNPRDVRFSQSDASPFFNNGKRVDDLSNAIRKGEITPNDLPPIRAIVKDGNLFTIDNRRLVAYGSSGVKEIPVQVVSADDQEIALILKDRFDPIRGEGRNIVIVPRADRAVVQQELYENGLIQGVQLGR